MCVWPRGIWRCLMSVYFLIQCTLSLLKSSLNFESWLMTVTKVLPAKPCVHLPHITFAQSTCSSLLSVLSKAQQPSPFPYRGAFIAQAPCGGVSFSEAPSWRPSRASLQDFLWGEGRTLNVFSSTLTQYSELSIFVWGSHSCGSALPLSWPLDPFHVLIKKYDGRSPHCCPFHLLIMLFQEAIKDLISVLTLAGFFLAECSLWCVQGRLFFYYSFVAWVYTVRENILCSLVLSFVEVLLLFISVCGLSWHVTKTSKMWMLLLMYGFFYICQFYPTASQSQSSLASWCIV